MDSIKNIDDSLKNIDPRLHLPTSKYIFEGVYFLLAHPEELWLKTFIPIILSFIFNVFSIGVSIGYLFPGAVRKFLEWNWPHWMSSFVSAVSTILGAAIFNLIFSSILVPIFQAKLFDTTLKSSGLERIFIEEEERHTPYYIVFWRKLRFGVLVMWFLLVVKILLVVLTAPLQLVPIIGNIVACYINGWPTAWSHRLHYDIVLRGWKVSESFKHAVYYNFKYINFGALAFALEIIPIVNIVFTWTNIIGTALWVADEYRIEKGIRVSDNDQQGTSKNDENTPLLGGASGSNHSA